MINLLCLIWTSLAPTIDAHGIRVHAVKSEFQAGTTQVRVLLPDRMVKAKRYPVLYVLPVEAKNGRRYGDGLTEIRRNNLHNKHDLICVAPTFSNLPWYADHPKDKAIRQESYFVNTVVPFVDKTYPTQAKQDGRLLLGFSKSGWGAFCLLLRHPKMFGRAAAWDAPLMMKPPGKYGSKPIFGSTKNFDRYRMTALLQSRGKGLGKSPRLILTGYGNFRTQHVHFRKLMQEFEVPHVYRDGPKRKHHWNGGWVPETVKLLLTSGSPKNDKPGIDRP